MQKQIMWLDELNDPVQQTNPGQEIIVLVPAVDVLLTQISLPKLAPARLRQALPYALEEQLVTEVSELHIAISEQAADGVVAVAVVAREKMAAWQQKLRSCNIAATCFLPSNLALPLKSHAWSIAIQGQQAWVRCSANQGFACDRENLAALITIHWHQTAERPEAITIFNCTKEAAPPFAEITCAVEEKFLSKAQLDNELMQQLQSEKPALNLLQGAYQQKRQLPSLKNAWFISGALGLSAVLLLFFGQIISYLILAVQVSSTNNEVAAIYKKYFPQASSIIAPKERMQAKWQQLLGQASDSQVFLLLAEVGKALAESRVDIQRLDYQQGRISIEVTAISFEALEKFTQSLRSEGLSVQQQNAALEEASVKTTLLVALPQKEKL